MCATKWLIFGTFCIQISQSDVVWPDFFVSGFRMFNVPDLSTPDHSSPRTFRIPDLSRPDFCRRTFRGRTFWGRFVGLHFYRLTSVFLSATLSVSCLSTRLSISCVTFSMQTCPSVCRHEIGGEILTFNGGISWTPYRIRACARGLTIYGGMHIITLTPVYKG